MTFSMNKNFLNFKSIAIRIEVLRLIIVSSLYNYQIIVIIIRYYGITFNKNILMME